MLTATKRLEGRQGRTQTVHLDSRAPENTEAGARSFRPEGDPKELGLTESDMGRSWFPLTSGCGGGGRFATKPCPMKRPHKLQHRQKPAGVLCLVFGAPNRSAPRVTDRLKRLHRGVTSRAQMEREHSPSPDAARETPPVEQVATPKLTECPKFRSGHPCPPPPPSLVLLLTASLSLALRSCGRWSRRFRNANWPSRPARSSSRTLRPPTRRRCSS